MNYLETKTYIKLKNMPQDNFPQFMVIHHTGGENGIDTSNQTAQIVEDYHLSLGWEGLGYQFYIDKMGIVWRGRPEKYHGAHVAEQGMNKKSIGICLAGNFDVTQPNQKQIDALTILMKEMMAKYNIPAMNIFPHRHYALNPNGTPYKSCYGTNLGETWARDLASAVPVTVQIPVPVMVDKEKFKKQIIDYINTL